MFIDLDLSGHHRRDGRFSPDQRHHLRSALSFGGKQGSGPSPCLSPASWFAGRTDRHSSIFGVRKGLAPGCEDIQRTLKVAPSPADAPGGLPDAPVPGARLALQKKVGSPNSVTEGVALPKEVPRHTGGVVRESQPGEYHWRRALWGLSQ